MIGYITELRDADQEVVIKRMYKLAEVDCRLKPKAYFDELGNEVGYGWYKDLIDSGVETVVVTLNENEELHVLAIRVRSLNG